MGSKPSRIFVLNPPLLFPRKSMGSEKGKTEEEEEENESGIRDSGNVVKVEMVVEMVVVILECKKRGSEASCQFSTTFFPIEKP